MNQVEHILEARGVDFGYREGEPVLTGVDFRAATGRLSCVLGPNGSGKTTLLRCLLGMLTPQAGYVLLDGRDVGGYSHRQLARVMAYVPQFPSSAFAFSVHEIVLTGRFPYTGPLGLTGKADREVAHQAMAMTQTLHLAKRTLEELSGGEVQRVMIARALAQQPRVLLLDEPTSHLDVKNQLVIHGMMVRLAHDWPMAVVAVSHDINLAGRFGDELVLMRDGRVVAAGPPAEVIRADVLRSTYGVEVELIPAGTAVPIVVAH